MFSDRFHFKSCQSAYKVFSAHILVLNLFLAAKIHLLSATIGSKPANMLKDENNDASVQLNGKNNRIVGNFLISKLNTTHIKFEGTIYGEFL